MRVKGKQLAVTLFTPLQQVSPENLPSDGELRLWRLALAAYRGQHWSEAQSHLDGLRAHHPQSPLNTLYSQLAERVGQFRRTPPPPSWDGVTNFDSK